MLLPESSGFRHPQLRTSDFGLQTSAFPKSGVQSPESGVWSPESGVQSPEPGVRTQSTQKRLNKKVAYLDAIASHGKSA